MMGIRDRVRQVLSGEIIRSSLYRLRDNSRSAEYFPIYVDDRQSDFAFWDSARRCRAKGLYISGALIKPLSSKIAAWVMPAPPSISMQNSAAMNKVNSWVSKNHASWVSALEESAALGDCYIVIYPDGVPAVISPNFVKPIRDQRDFSRTIGWQIARTFRGNAVNEEMTIIEEFYQDSRTVEYVFKGSAKQKSRKVTYKNVIGKIPIVHVANRVGADEEFGRPEAEGAIEILHAYGRVLEAAINGNIRQGRPTPVISKMGSAEEQKEFWEKYGRRETVTDDNGESKTVWVIDFNPDMLVTLSGTAEFDYKAPASFTKDTQTILELLFYLFLQHTEVPEFVWGNAIASSKASAESQLEPFIYWIEKKRGFASKWMLNVIEIFIDYLSVYDVDFMDGLGANNDFQLTWKPLTKDGKLTLDTIVWAHKTKLITDDQARALLPIYSNVNIQAFANYNPNDDATREGSIETT